MVFFSQFLCTTGTENRFMVTTVTANMHTHVLDNTEHRNLDFLEHHNAFFRIDQRNVLRSGDHYRASYWYVLSQCQLNVTGDWRHIKHKIVEIRPQGLQ